MRRPGAKQVDFRHLRGLGLVALLLLNACTVVGPDYQGVSAPLLPRSWDPDAAATHSKETAAWWLLFEDDVLTELIQRGASQNLSLEAAGLRIVQARAVLGISDSLIYPQQSQINSDFTYIYRDEDDFTSASATYDVGWELDIWGKYARGIESAEARLYASIASYRDVLVTVCAEIARNYINYRTAQERIYLSERNIAIQQRVVEMTQVQFDSGNVSELDVQQAKTQLYATQSALPALNISRLQARNAIAVLVGARPEDVEPLLNSSDTRERISIDESILAISREEDLSGDYGAISVIPTAPVPASTISSQLILRRPDLQVAELQARAQSADIGFAEADLYPQFFLFGSVGVSQTVRAGDSFDASDALTAAIGPGLSWNIFQFDRIKNQVRIEDARFQESLANYNRTVLEAINEVTIALEAYQNNLERSEINLRGVQASIRAFNISANQYSNGLVNYQRLLSTVENMTIREDSYAQTRGSMANQIVALYKALGGGWEPFAAQPVVSPEAIEQMKSRIDWGDQLEPDTLSGADRDD